MCEHYAPVGDSDVLQAEKAFTMYLPGHTLIDWRTDSTLCSCGEEGASGIPVSQKWKWSRAHKAKLLGELDRHITDRRPAPKAMPFDGDLGLLIVRRYWMLVIDAPDDECWSWGGPTSASAPGFAYGKISVPGRPPVLAHRVSHLIHHGPIPAGHDVLHACNNPPCTNPRHLSAGTHADNMRDMGERGRVWNRGRQKATCKRGHPLEGENLRLVGAAQVRVCRECKRQWKREARAGGRIK